MFKKILNSRICRKNLEITISLKVAKWAADWMCSLMTEITRHRIFDHPVQPEHYHATIYLPHIQVQSFTNQ
jgi:hypothetical protein